MYLATLGIFDTRLQWLPALLVAGSRFSITIISANSNLKSKRLQHCVFVTNRFTYSKKSGGKLLVCPFKFLTPYWSPFILFFMLLFSAESHFVLGRDSNLRLTLGPSGAKKINYASPCNSAKPACFLYPFYNFTLCFPILLSHVLHSLCFYLNL